MGTALPAAQPRGISYDLPTCREIWCHGRGVCVLPPGGGAGFACECDLGYQGEYCEETVNGSLSLPLCLGVVGFLVGFTILAFVLAKLRQKHNQRRRYRDLQQRLAKRSLCDAARSP